MSPAPTRILCTGVRMSLLSLQFIDHTCVAFTLVVFQLPLGRCYTNGARNQGLGPVVLNPIWEIESPESFQDHHLCLACTLDLELGRAESSGTFQSLLPPGGAVSNSLACHQHLCEQTYSAPKVLRMPSSGGRERGWDLGTLEAPPLPSCFLLSWMSLHSLECSREKPQPKTATDRGMVLWFP